MAKIQTVNQLISVFKDIATRHYQINGFGIGDDWENGASEEKMHPVLWINPVTANMPESESTGYKTFEIDFEVRVFDLVSKGESNENDVLSDCIDILKDIILEFKGHPYYVNSQLNIIDDISFEAFTEEFDEDVSGWVCELSLMTPILNSFCGIPAADITGFEFPGIDCPDVNVLCPVFVEDVTGVYPIVVNTVGTTKEVSIVGGVGSDTYVISGVYDTGTLTLTRNDAVDVVVTGFDTGGDNDYTTSATLSGNIITFDRTDTVGAYSVDLTTAINSAPDKFVSSGAYDSINNKIVLTLNDASTVDIDTSAIGGGASIYTADDIIGAGRVATLTDSLTFEDGTVNVQGIGTSGSSALTIYDNDTTPSKLWDFLDNGGIDVNQAVDINTSNTFNLKNGTRSIGATSWNTHTYWGLNNGVKTWTLISANASGVYNQDEFSIGVTGSQPAFRAFEDSVGVGGLSKTNFDTSFSLHAGTNGIKSSGSIVAEEGIGGANKIELDFNNYPKVKITNGTTEYWLVEGDGTGSAFTSGELYLYDATNGRKLIHFLSDGNIDFPNLPTSAPTKGMWNDGGTLKIA